jgi:hypothetical protein
MAEDRARRRGGGQVTPSKAIRGPRSWRGLVEAADRLDASSVVRSVRKQHPGLWRRWTETGEAVLCRVEAAVIRRGVPSGRISLGVGLDGTRGAVAFPNGSTARLSAALAFRRDPSCGFRWIWVCPQRGHRCTRLYRPAGAEGFASREAHRLRHRSARGGPPPALELARRLRQRLGQHPAELGGELPDRPEWLRKASYRKLVLRLMAAERDAFGVRENADQTPRLDRDLVG